jgi:hypothetical protein
MRHAARLVEWLVPRARWCSARAPASFFVLVVAAAAARGESA